MNTPKKNEIFIGREVDKGDYLIGKQFIAIERKHARIIQESDGIYIEDLDSAHGTFVNGKPIILKKINASDKITLGGIHYYELPLEKVLKLLPIPDKEFQSKFLQLKQVYEDYRKAKAKIQDETQGGLTLKRSLPVALPSLLMVILPFFFDIGNPQVSLYIQMLGGALFLLAILISSIWASSTMAKAPERLNNLLEKFLIEYVCPNCGQEFGERSWKNIEKRGKCEACQREFHID